MNQKRDDIPVIKIECLGCHEMIDYTIKLPTAIECDKCGMISEARLSLHRKNGILLRKKLQEPSDGAKKVRRRTKVNESQTRFK